MSHWYPMRGRFENHVHSPDAHSKTVHRENPLGRFAWVSLLVLLVALSLAATGGGSQGGDKALFEAFPLAAYDIHSQRFPAIGGSSVFWADSRDSGVAQYPEIYRWDAATASTERITFNTSAKNQPSADGDWVVWEENREGHFDIYAMNINNEVARRITSDSFNQTQPDVSYPWIVYQDDRNGAKNMDIWAYSLESNTSRRLTQVEGRQMTPVVSENVAAWVDIIHIEGLYVSTSRIVALDLSTDEQRIPSPEIQAQQSYVEIDYPLVVWQDNRNAAQSEGWDLYAYDWETKQTLKIVGGPGSQHRPQIAWPHLVWLELTSEGEARDVYYWNMDKEGGHRRIDSEKPGPSDLAVGRTHVAWSQSREGGGRGASDVWAARISDGLAPSATPIDGSPSGAPPETSAATTDDSGNARIPQAPLTVDPEPATDPGAGRTSGASFVITAAALIGTCIILVRTRQRRSD